MPEHNKAIPTLGKDSLLGELESIKDMLDKDISSPIPTLDNALPEKNAQTIEPDKHQPVSSNRPDFSSELMIQEIVDEFIPLIEASLRQQLSACTAEMIQQLAEKHLKD